MKNLEFFGNYKEFLGILFGRIRNNLWNIFVGILFEKSVKNNCKKYLNVYLQGLHH